MAIIFDQEGIPITGDNPFPVQLSGSSAALDYYDYDASTTVEAGATETRTIVPATLDVALVTFLAFTVNGPIGATSGTHSVSVLVGSSDDQLHARLFYAKSAFNLAVQITPTVQVGSVFKVPSTSAEYFSALMNLAVSAAAPLTVVYTNNTDVAQTGNRRLRVALREQVL